MVIVYKCKDLFASLVHQGFPDLPGRSFPLTGTIHSTTSLPQHPHAPVLLPLLLSFHLNPCHVHIPADDKLLPIYTRWQQQSQIVPVHERVSRVTGPTVQTMGLSIMLSHNKTEQDYTHTETAEPPSLYLWQVGQSRLQSKVLSFPQPSFPAGLG